MQTYDWKLLEWVWRSKRNLKQRILKYVFNDYSFLFVWSYLFFAVCSYFICLRSAINIFMSAYLCLKVVRTMLETLNLVSKNIHTHVVSENIIFSNNTPLILLMSVFFQYFKKSILFCKNSTFTQSSSMRVVLEIFWFCFQFL